jgi:hypothetical protein
VSYWWLHDITVPEEGEDRGKKKRELWEMRRNEWL